MELSYTNTVVIQKCEVENYEYESKDVKIHTGTDRY